METDTKMRVCRDCWDEPTNAKRNKVQPGGVALRFPQPDGYRNPVFNPISSGDTTNAMVRNKAFVDVKPSKKGFIIATLRLDGGDDSDMYIWDDNFVQLSRGADNKFQLVANSTPGVPAVLVKTIGTYKVANTASYITIAAAWDTGNNYAKIFVGQVADFAVTTLLNQNIGYNNTAFPTFLCDVGVSIGLIGTCAQFAYGPGQMIDVTDQKMRDRYLQRDGRPVPFGDGLLLTGNPVACILTDKVASLRTNHGSGGNFSYFEGAFTDAAVGP